MSPARRKRRKATCSPSLQSIHYTHTEREAISWKPVRLLACPTAYLSAYLPACKMEIEVDREGRRGCEIKGEVRRRKEVETCSGAASARSRLLLPAVDVACNSTTADRCRSDFRRLLASSTWLSARSISLSLCERVRWVKYAISSGRSAAQSVFPYPTVVLRPERERARTGMMHRQINPRLARTILCLLSAKLR